MMYCSYDDLTKKVSESTLIYLTDEIGTGSVDMEKIEDAIKSAQVEIDPYARKRYNTPFNPVPESIKRLTVDIAVYNLYSLKGLSESDQTIKDRYNAAIKFLERLALGKVTLGEGESVTPSPSGSMLEITSNKRIFSRKRMRDF